MSRPVVIARILYGLGNQLFQYATARRLAHVLDAELKLDITCFQHWKVYPYRLNLFQVRETLASPEECARFNSIAIPSYLGKLWFRLRQIVTLRDWTILYENEVGPADPRVLNAKGNVYLGGYWQSEKYFRDIRDILRQEFALKPEPDAENRRLAAEIGGCESVSLHVRHGWDVTDAYSGRAVGTCDLDYYARCIAEIGRRVKNPHLFLFSDHMEWARQNIRAGFPITPVTHNGPERDYEDFRLMGLCRHHIISNSSFSWWAAWLSPHEDPVVLAPRRYCKDPRIDTRDIVPEAWTRL